MQTYLEFMRNPPQILYGQINVNGKAKFGEFRYTFNYFSNCWIYQYYTLKGKKGTGGFTVKRALNLLIYKILSTDPEHGKVENYV